MTGTQWQKLKFKSIKASSRKTDDRISTVENEQGEMMEILEDPGDVQPLNYNKMFMEKEPRIYRLWIR